MVVPEEKNVTKSEKPLRFWNFFSHAIVELASCLLIIASCLLVSLQTIVIRSFENLNSTNVKE